MANSINSGSITADGNTAVTLIRNRDYIFRVNGADFGSGTVKLQVLGPDGSNYQDYTIYDGTSWDSVSFAAAGMFEFTSAGQTHRVNMAGSTTPTVSWEIIDRTADFQGE